MRDMEKLKTWVRDEIKDRSRPADFGISDSAYNNQEGYLRALEDIVDQIEYIERG